MKTVDGTELYQTALEKINELLEENAELRAKLGLALTGKAIHHIDGNPSNNDYSRHIGVLMIAAGGSLVLNAFNPGTLAIFVANSSRKK